MAAGPNRCNLGRSPLGGDPWLSNRRVRGLEGSYRYYNGALFGSLDIAGSVIVRRNHVRDAFNAIRMVVRDPADL